MSAVHNYLCKRALYPQLVPSPPPPDLKLAIVIPCYDEPNLLQTLDSLWQCAQPGCGVEIIVVVNQPPEAGESARRRNRRTLQTAREWSRRRQRPGFGCLVIGVLEPGSQAGVGFARKVGMDEAARRLEQVRQPQGLIVGLDADCRVAANYLAALYNYQRTRPESMGCCIYFEHPIEDAAGPARQAVIDYELGLRYYVQGLKYAGHPQALHTIGSAMAVRAQHYAAQGGMNRHQAGEDFYFIQKLSYGRIFCELNDTTVYPSPRASARTPFGTGRAIQQSLDGERDMAWTWSPAVFLDLRGFLSRAADLYETDYGSLRGQLPEAVDTFLQAREFTQHLQEIRGNVASKGRFIERFYRWFNAFQVFRYIRFATDHYYPKRPLGEAAEQLCAWSCAEPARDLNHTEWLQRYRCMDRHGSQSSPAVAACSSST